MWISWGVYPGMVIGHSVGEYAAAYLAGVFSLEDAIKLISARGRLMHELTEKGSMLVAFTSKENIIPLIDQYTKTISIAAENGPQNIVFSGSTESIKDIEEKLIEAKIKTTKLDVSHAFHSPLMKPILSFFKKIAKEITYHKPLLPLVSNVTGDIIGDDICSSDYWVNHIEATVQFAAGVRCLEKNNINAFLEIGPGTTISSMLMYQVKQEPGILLTSLRKKQSDWKTILDSLSTLYVHGAQIDWEAYWNNEKQNKVDLPTYPFTKNKYWHKNKVEWFKLASNVQTDVSEHQNSSQKIPRTTNFDYNEILAQLKAMLADALGSDANEIADNTHLLELGADSIILMDVVRYVEDYFNLKLSVRQFFEELTTLQALAGYIEKENAKSENSINNENAGIKTDNDLTSEKKTLSKATEHGSGGNGSKLNKSSILPAWKNKEINSAGVSDKQQLHIKQLASAYNQKTLKSKKFTNKYRPTLADNRASAGFRFSTKELLYPIVSEKSKGSKIWDIDDNEYIDITMGFGSNLFGHNQEFIKQAIQDQLAKGMHIGPQCALVGDVVQLIVELTGAQRVCFANTGTEAVMTALRIVRAVTNRKKIVMFSGSYHGHFDGVLGMTKISGLGNEPMAPGILDNFVDDLIILKYGAEEALTSIEQNKEDIAGVLVEPVQSRHPDLQPKEFIKKIRNLTEKIDIPLIFDEMITGFRILPGGAQAYFGIKADISTYGKIVGGGMPIGVIAGKAKYLDAVDGGAWNYADASYPKVEATFLAGTFTKHPLTMAAAKAVLNKIKATSRDQYEQLNKRTEVFINELNDWFEEKQYPFELVNFGSLFRLKFTGNYDILFYHLLNKGLYVWEGRNCFLSFAHSDEDIEFIKNTFKASVIELDKNGFFVAGNKDEKTGQKNTNNKIPLSIAQKQLFALEQIDSEGALAYLIIGSIKINGQFQIGNFQKAITNLIERHESLRYRILEDGEYLEIAANSEVKINVHDFSGYQEDKRNLKWKEFLHTNNNMPFDLNQGTLFRVDVIKMKAQEYRITFTLHHIISDGWSFDIILKELSALYNNEISNHHEKLGHAFQYSAYLEWLDQSMKTVEWESHEKYLMDNFASGSMTVNLPFDYSKLSKSGFKSNKEILKLPKEMAAAIKQFSIKNGYTQFMVLISFFKLLIHRLSGQDEIVLGIPVSGRSLINSEKCVGYFAHIMPVKSVYDSRQTYQQFLSAVKESLLNAYDHQDYPYGVFLERMKEQKLNKKNNFINVIFNMDVSFNGFSSSDLKSEILDDQSEYGQFDLGMNIMAVKDELLLIIDYRTDLFKQETISRFLKYYYNICKDLLKNKNQKINNINMLPQEELEQLLIEWNDTGRKFSEAICLHQLFEKQAEKYPDNVAIVFEEKKLTYKELNEKSNQVAHYLQSKGVKPETLVAICVERSVEMMVGLLGILKAGGAYVPLDPEYPQGRLAYMLKDSQSSVLISQDSLLAILPEHNAEVICLDKDWSVIDKMAKSNVDSGVNDSNLAYVIYTSGSTGNPKGVMTQHNSIANRLLWNQWRYQLTSEDALLQKTTFCFDVSVWELFCPMLAGCRLVLAKPGGHRDNQYLINIIKNEKISIIDFVPAMLQVMIATPGFDECPSLKRVFVGGEALSAELMNQYYEFLDIPLHNFYGPTEAAIDVTSFECIKGSDLTRIPIGKPLANTQLYILNKDLKPVPVGVVGELHIGGIQLARGYLNREALTKEKFIDNPFADAPGAKLYKTGDHVRYLEDGNIEYLGRIDDQVKIRGFRIELGEIESAINVLEFVRTCVVLVKVDKSGNKHLVAYVIGNKNELDVKEIKDTISKKLPDYMVPSQYISLDAMPLTSNGKINRKALPEPEGQLVTSAEYVPPGNEIEQVLADIWSEVLGVEYVGIHDNFFELGGDSILSIQIGSRARNAGLALTPKDIYEHQSILELSKVSGKKAAVINAEQGEVKGEVKLNPIQAWYFEQNFQDIHHWNQAVLINADKLLDHNHLKNALNAIVKQHDALRLRYSEKNGKWIQEHKNMDNHDVEVIDLSNISENELSKVMEDQATKIQAGLSISEGPIFRVVLFKIAESQNNRLLIVIHHLVIDGVSWRIIFEDMEKACRQQLNQQSISLGLKTSSFKKWNETLVGYAQSGKLSEEISYWSEVVSRKVKQLPVDFVERNNSFESVDVVNVRVDKKKTQHLLQQATQAYNTEINDLLLTALAVTLNKWTKNSSFIIELEGHGRERITDDIDVSRTVGWFTSIYPVYLNINEALKISDIIKSVKEQLRAVPGNGFGYGIQKYLSDNRSGSSLLEMEAKPQLLFNYLGQFDNLFSHSMFFSAAKESSGRAQGYNNHATHELEINASVLAGHLNIDWSFSKNKFNRGTIEKLAENYVLELKCIIEHCIQPEAKGYTSSDFPLAEVDQEALDKVLAGNENTNAKTSKEFRI